MSHPLLSLTCCELQQTRWYYSGVISSLMRPNCQLRAFNAEVTASPRIAPPPCPHSCPTVLVLLFGTTGRAVFEGVLFSPSVTLVGRGQDGPRRCLLATWAFPTHPRTFLLSRCRPWAWYEMGWALPNPSAPQVVFESIFGLGYFSHFGAFKGILVIFMVL